MGGMKYLIAFLLGAAVMYAVIEFDGRPQYTKAEIDHLRHLELSFGRKLSADEKVVQAAVYRVSTKAQAQRRR